MFVGDLSINQTINSIYIPLSTKKFTKWSLKNSPTEDLNQEIRLARVHCQLSSIKPSTTVQGPRQGPSSECQQSSVGRGFWIGWEESGMEQWWGEEIGPGRMATGRANSLPKPDLTCMDQNELETVISLAQVHIDCCGCRAYSEEIIN